MLGSGIAGSEAELGFDLIPYKSAIDRAIRGVRFPTNCTKLPKGTSDRNMWTGSGRMFLFQNIFPVMVYHFLGTVEGETDAVTLFLCLILPLRLLKERRLRVSIYTAC